MYFLRDLFEARRGKRLTIQNVERKKEIFKRPYKIKGVTRKRNTGKEKKRSSKHEWKQEEI